MKVKIFGSHVKVYGKIAEYWFAENKNLEVKHISIALNQGGDWILTAVFFEEKESLAGSKNNT